MTRFLYNIPPVHVQYMYKRHSLTTCCHRQVLFEGARYRQFDSLTVTLNAYETVQIQEFNERDLSGTRVVADKNVAVFSGNFHTGECVTSLAAAGSWHQ